MLRAGIDIGGTFTDLVIYDEVKKTLKISKVPTDREKPWKSIIRALEENIDILEDIKEIRHGTTLGVNTVIERKGPKTAILTTEGFRDLLEIGRQKRPYLYDLKATRPPPLVPRRMRYTVRQRTAHDGMEIIPLDEAGVKKAAHTFKDEGVDAVAVLFLNSYADSSHEKKAADLINSILPEAYVSISSGIIPEFREFERLSTTVLNAYLGPVMTEYIKKLQQKFRYGRIESSFYICQSDGGISSAATTVDYPVRTLYSGPAAGVMGTAAVFGKDCRQIVTLDMGGTSTDISLIMDSKPVMTTGKEIDGLPLRFPTIDLQTIGAGGGSILEIDKGGFLKVGPKSAGANPGPACYSKGGTLPTLTDTNLILGLLDKEKLLGGRISLDIARSLDAVKGSLLSRLDLGINECCLAVIRIVISNISESIKKMVASRGIHPAELRIVAFGGAGPMHAAFIARELGVSEVIIPADPGVFSASGLFAGDITMDFVKTVRSINPYDLRDLIGQMNGQARSWFEKENIKKAEQRLSWSLDMRYEGQNHEINIEIDGPDLKFDARSMENIGGSFHARHLDIYGHSHPDKKTELVNLRLRATGLSSIDTTDRIERSTGNKSVGCKKTRKVLFPPGKVFLEADIYDGKALPEGPVPGPSIIEGLDSTVVIPPGSNAEIDDDSNMIIKLDY